MTEQIQMLLEIAYFSMFKVLKVKLSLGAPVNWQNEREKSSRNWYNCIKIRQKRIKTR